MPKNKAIFRYPSMCAPGNKNYLSYILRLEVALKKITGDIKTQLTHGANQRRPRLMNYRFLQQFYPGCPPEGARKLKRNFPLAYSFFLMMDAFNHILSILRLTYFFQATKELKFEYILKLMDTLI